MTPLVSKNFGLGVGFDSPIPFQQHQHNIQMISTYIPVLNDSIAYCISLQELKPSRGLTNKTEGREGKGRVRVGKGE